MKILFTGRGTSGSWQCRGVQLGGELGTVKAKATLEDMRAADLIVLVKRPSPNQIQAIQKSGKPWVWDVVDFYPQPECTNWSRDKSIAWVKKQIDSFSPTGVVFPNHRMRKDCGSRRPDAVVYHHHRPGIAANPIRQDFRVVGYEGSPRYLGAWEKALTAACKERGMTFTTEGSHAHWDACVAFRDDPYNGYAQSHWKSNVKLANCHGSGTPFIGSPENGYLETGVGGELFCVSRETIGECLDMLTYEKRKSISERFLKNRYPLEQAASDLKAFLDGM